MKLYIMLSKSMLIYPLIHNCIVLILVGKISGIGSILVGTESKYYRMDSIQLASSLMMIPFLSSPDSYSINLNILQV